MGVFWEEPVPGVLGGLGTSCCCLKCWGVEPEDELWEATDPMEPVALLLDSG